MKKLTAFNLPVEHAVRLIDVAVVHTQYAVWVQADQLEQDKSRGRVVGVLQEKKKKKMYSMKVKAVMWSVSLKTFHKEF